MIYLSIVVPSYNAEKYLDRCIPSLVPGGDDVEIIIVNDGSKDNTLQVANSYKEKFSNVKVIDKENGGHGSGINAALEVAQGLYFKCVDADDWVDLDAYIQLLSTIKTNYDQNILPDLYLTNFVYNRLDENKTLMLDKSHAYPPNRLLKWEDLPKPNNDDFFMMHMFIYKLSVVKESKLKLPEHTFYVDNLYVYQPLYYVKTMWFVPVPLYQYYCGHADQSISYANMAKNFMHEMRVYEQVVNVFTYDDFLKLDKPHRKNMMFALVVNSALALFHSAIAKKNGSKKAYKKIMKDFKKNNRELYKQLNWHTEFWWTNLIIPGLKDVFIKIGYNIVKKKTGWY